MTCVSDIKNILNLNVISNFKLVRNIFHKFHVIHKLSYEKLSFPKNIRKISSISFQIIIRIVLSIMLILSINHLQSQTNFASDNYQKVFPDSPSILDREKLKAMADSVLIEKGRWSAGPSYTIAAQGNIVCYNKGAYLEFVQFLKPSSFNKISQLMLNFLPVDMLFWKKFLYVRNNADKILVIDLHNPEKPFIIAQINLGPEPIFDWKISGDKIFLSKGNAIKVIDQLNPIQNVLTIRTFKNFESFVHSLSVNEKFILAQTEENGYLISLDEIKQKKSIPELSTRNDVHELLLVDSTIYSITSGKIGIYKLTDSLNLHFVSSANLNYNLPEVKTNISGRNLYITSPGNFLTIMDVTTPLKPEIIFSSSGKIFDYTISDSLLFLTCYDHIKIIDMGVQQNFEVNEIIPVGGSQSHLIGVKNNFAYLQNETGDLTVLDFSNSNFPEEHNILKGTKRGSRLVQYHNFAYQIVGDNLKIFDLTHSGDPKYIGYFNLGFTAWDLEIFSDYLFLSSYRNGLQVLDISNPVYPKEFAHFPELKFGKMQIVQNKLYCENISTFQIFNIGDPHHPEFQSSYEVNSYINDFYVNKDKAYLCIDESGLLCLGISDPTHPEVIQMTPGDYDRCLAQADFLFTTPPIKVFYIADPANPILLKEFRIDDYFDEEIDLAIYNNLIFASEPNLGLFVFENKYLDQKKTQPTISKSFPNPFNSVITIRYRLPKDNHVQIDIFDIQGHHIKNLVKIFQQKGEYDIQWDAKNSLDQPVASGVYLYRIIAGDIIETQKILLIR